MIFNLIRQYWMQSNNDILLLLVIAISPECIALVRVVFLIIRIPLRAHLSTFMVHVTWLGSFSFMCVMIRLAFILLPHFIRLFSWVLSVAVYAWLRGVKYFTHYVLTTILHIQSRHVNHLSVTTVVVSSWHWLLILV